MKRVRIGDHTEMILTGKAALIFKDKMLHPDKEAIDKQNRVFEKIKEELTPTETGFIVIAKEGGNDADNN